MVFLFSGYLYAVNGLFPIDGVRQLVDGLCSTSCAVVTSDPFLGELFRLDESTFSEQHPARRQLAEHFAQIVPILARVKHLYRAAPRAGAAGGSVSFYNPQTVLDQAARSAWTNRALDTPGIRPELKRWLFVLSAEDYAAGTVRWGNARFDETLRGKLLETAMAGRQPVLIGPPASIEAMRQGELTPVTALLFEFCDSARFLSLLYEAEYCFYWNVFSHSIIARVMNQGPVFFFDWGHLVHALPSSIRDWTTSTRVGVRGASRKTTFFRSGGWPSLPSRMIAACDRHGSISRKHPRPWRWSRIFCERQAPEPGIGGAAAACCHFARGEAVWANSSFSVPRRSRKSPTTISRTTAPTPSRPSPSTPRT
ncbi:MAG TPA: hypothetical protein VHX68_21415 [Planctomycetaceae bacterium]|nr:hypothetical protein [Planctomycetaceae bacterium]